MPRTVTPPDDRLERAARARGFARVAGVDEVGRGPLAGPVTAAAVVIDPVRIPPGLKDSKQLSPRARAALADKLRGCADIGIGHASVDEIDRLNILQASHLAMRRAIDALMRPADFLLIDGNRMPGDLPCPAQTVIRGDTLSVSIAAASIVAKLCRDAIMVDLAQQHPGYGWETNAGYPSPAHKTALRDLGATPHHRRSFRPVHNILYQEKSISP
ncbi:MAG: ribonuclease HII [Rhodobacteraceae bacterium]|nr:ribonuclease HII [Paracoccaceae bacterium]